MCAPLIVMGVLMAASAAVSIAGQNEQASAARKSAMDAYDINMQQKNLEQVQLNKQASQEEQQRIMQAQATEARMTVAAGESGVSGISVDRNINEIQSTSEQDIATMEANRKGRIDQTQLESQGTRSRTQSTINQNRGVGNLTAGLQIASAGMQGASMGASMSKGV